MLVAFLDDGCCSLSKKERNELKSLNILFNEHHFCMLVQAKPRGTSAYARILKDIKHFYTKWEMTGIDDYKQTDLTDVSFHAL